MKTKHNTDTRAAPPSQYESEQLRLNKLSTHASLGMLVVSALALILAAWQFSLARTERKEATTALDLANRAQESSARAEERIAAHEQALTNLTVQLEHSAEMARIHDLTIRAESGERAAFVALQKIVDEAETNSDPFYISFAQKNINRIFSIFTSDRIQDPGVSMVEGPFPPIWPTNIIPVNLTADNYETRALAVATIGKMRLNSFIPQLADMAFAEPDLYVLQLIVRTINNAFEHCAPRVGFSINDFLYPYYDGRSKFEAQWKEFGPKLLKRKPLYIKTEPWGENASHQMIIDPEAEQWVTGRPSQCASSPEP